MSKVDRNNPRIAGGSEATYTFSQFEKDFPDDATCLDWLVGYLYPDGIYCPKDQKVTPHYRVKKRTSYSCQFCGHHEHPMRGTIFEDSATSLKLWFHGIFLMSQTRCGISAKQLERELGVTYKTAWRMFHKIRSMLAQDDDEMLSGTVEVDETFIGGKPRAGQVRNKQEGRMWAERKAKALGAVERGGRIVAKVVPDRKAGTVVPFVREKVLPGSTVYTDEWRPYRGLRDGYEHSRINHSAKVYVSGDVHTQTIEGFWALLKGGLIGVYHGVSERHLQMYLDEYAFRYNNRGSERGMFSAFLARIVRVAPA